MRIVTLARKPLVGIVAANTLGWGTGGINIDGCRIYIGSQPLPTVAPGWDSLNKRNAEEGYRPGAYQQGGAEYTPHLLGRWPPNVILCHSPFCNSVGSRAVTTGLHYPEQRGEGSQTCGPSGHKGQRGLIEARPGVEYQEQWECHPDCPVFFLDQQTGVLHSGSDCIKQASGSDKNGNRGSAYGKESRPVGSPQIFYGDAGGASRFFKQVQVTSMATIPQDLIDYLLTLISPPPPTDPAVYWDAWRDTREFKDNSLTGILLTAAQTVTEDQAKELNRILMPGAHLLMVNPDDDPTGALGACEVEDAGLEIRDTILLLQPGDKDFHYVAKAGRSEREAGCKHMPGRTGAEAVDRKEGSAGLDNPRAGAGRNVGKENVRYQLKTGLPEDTVSMIHERLIEAGVEFDVDAFVEEDEDADAGSDS